MLARTEQVADADLQAPHGGGDAGATLGGGALQVLADGGELVAGVTQLGNRLTLSGPPLDGLALIVDGNETAGGFLNDQVVSHVGLPPSGCGGYGASYYPGCR